MKEIRYIVEKRNYAPWDRLRIWFYEARIAIFRAPPRQYYLRVRVLPGEVGYDDAPYELTTSVGLGPKVKVRKK